MATKKNKPVRQIKPPMTIKRYVSGKAIVVVVIIILFLLLYIDSKTGFIKSMVGDKTFEIRIRK